MPKMYHCKLNCKKKTDKGWCKDHFAIVDEEGNCDRQEVPVKTKQQALF